MRRVFLALLLSLFADTAVAEFEVVPYASTPDSTALALVLGGAISLGDFEAGAIAELVAQLERFNRLDPEGRRYYIDVLAGASAGSLTLSMLARELLTSEVDFTDDQGFRDYVEGKNIFHRAWVQDIDVFRLLPKGDLNDGANPFLLPDEYIDCMGEKYLKPIEAPVVPMRLAADTLLVAMSISNQAGMQYSIPLRGTNGKTFVRHDDYRLFRIEATSGSIPSIALLNRRFEPAAEADWPTLRASAIASRAVPFAFAPDWLSKSVAEYQGSSPAPTGLRASGSTFVDGGFFNNDPFGIAQELEAHLGRRNRLDTRFPADPTLRKTISIEPDRSHSDPFELGSVNESLPKYASHTLSMLRNNASTDDLYGYLRNLEARKLDFERAVKATLELAGSGTPCDGVPELLGVLAQTGEDEDSIGPESDPALVDSLTARIASAARERFGPVAGLDRIERDPSRCTRELFLRLVELFDAAPRSDVLSVHEEEWRPLPGRHLGHFGAFLNEALREHDYRLGRLAAQQLLANQFGIDPFDAITEQDVAVWECEMKDAVGDSRAFLRRTDRSPTIRDHMPDPDDRKDLRERLYQRSRGYAKHVAPGMFEYPIHRTIASLLDDHVHHRTLPWMFNAYKATTVGDQWQLGLRHSPWQSPDPQNHGWFDWTFKRSAYFGLDVNFSPPWREDHRFNYLAPYLRFSLYDPYPQKSFLDFALRHVRLELESGVRLAIDGFHREHDWGRSFEPYAAVGLRIFMFELRWEAQHGVEPWPAGWGPSQVGVSFGSLAVFGG